MKWIKFLGLLLPTLLTGCSYFSSTIKTKDTAYLSAKSIPPLKIPPGISSDAFQASYPVSERNYPEDAKKIDLTPPGL